MIKFYAFLLKQRVFIYLLTILGLGMGLFSLSQMQREAFPKVEFGVVKINTIYPGASPEEIEKFVTTPIEDELNEVDGIDFVESISAENRSAVIVTFEPGIDVDEKQTDIQRLVDQIEDFPEDTKQPLIEKVNSSKFPIINVDISGTTSYKKLRETAKLLEEKLELVPGVADIQKLGFQDPEFKVLVNPNKLQDNYIGLSEIIQVLSQRHINVPGGSIKNRDREIILRSLGELKTTKDIESVILRTNDVGRQTKIRDIAKVQRGYEDKSIIQKANKHDAISLIILKKEKADIIRTIKEIRQVVKDFETQNSELGYHYNLSNDISHFINRRLNVLINNAWIGIIIVLFTLFIFINLKMSIRVAIGIPFSIFISFTLMNLSGISINLVSLLGFILVIGMIVDNGIVVAEHIFHKYENGRSVEEATSEGTSEMTLPILASTFTTFAAFLPLLLMGGTIGKFVWSIPVVVVFCLIGSLFYALVILPNLVGISLIKEKGPVKPRTWYKALVRKYSSLLQLLLRFRYLVLIAFFGMLVSTIMLAASNMKFVLFPNEDAENFFIQVEGQTDMGLLKNESLMKQIFPVIESLGEDELEFYSTSVGLHQTDQSNSKIGSHFGQISVFLHPTTERKRKARDIVEYLRENINALNLPYKTISFTINEGGPPVGKSVQVLVSGNDYAEINKISETVLKELKTIPGVKDANTNFKAGKKEIRIKINEAKASFAQISMQQIALAVRSAYEGTIATSVKVKDEDIDVRIQYDNQFRQNDSYLSSIQIKNKNGKLVPLSQVVEFYETTGYSDLYHYNKKKTITVFSDIDKDSTTAMQANKEMGKYLDSIKKDFPGVNFKQRGENEESAESIQNLMKAFVIAIILIYSIIAILFNSFLEPFIIMMAIPFGIVGVILAFFLHNEPISFMMIMGSIGMSGVVVNNTIILVHVIDQHRQSGIPLIQAVVKGGEQRLRAVLVTSITTLFALFPTAYGIGGSDPFVKPMCLALAWGLFLSTVLTLLMLPCLYIIFDDIKSKCRLKKQVPNNQEII